MGVNTAVTDTSWSPNYSPGRPAGPPTSITIHHWGVDGQQHQKVVNYLCTPRGDKSTSAHYVASAGRVTQLVHDYDRAWHATKTGNPRSIGIECRPEMSGGDFETVTRLIAAIRSEWGHLPLVPHSHWVATSCPGRWLPRLTELSARADQIAGGSPTTTVPQEDDMTPEQAAQLNRIEGYLKVPGYPFGYPAATHNALGTLTARVAAQAAAIQALATSKGLDAAVVTKTIDEAVTKALADVEITLSAKEA